MSGGIRGAGSAQIIVASWLGALAAALAFAGGCSQAKPAAGPAGPDDGGEGGHLPCPGSTTCQDKPADVVFSCEPDGTRMPLETCKTDQLCSLGRCVSETCQMAELRPGITGCLFYTAVLDNVDSDDGKPTLIMITNAGGTRATVELEERGAASEWVVTQTVTVEPGSANSFSVVAHAVSASGAGAPTGPSAPVARRVISDMPVSVMLVQSDNVDGTSTSSAGTMILPAHALGVSYMAIAYPQSNTDKVARLAGSWGGAAEVAVVATQDHTTLWIYPRTPVPNAMPKVVLLDADGDAHLIVTTNDQDDLSGTMIVADKRVAVFSGNIATTYGLPSPGINSADMAMEQMTPTGTWSKNYVAARLPAQIDACTSLFDPGIMSFWRVVALNDANITFASASGPAQLGLPAGSFHILRGSPVGFQIKSQDDFLVHSDQPILVTQGMDCEPTLASAVNADAQNDQELFTLAPNFDHMLAIVRQVSGGARVTLDGNDITGEFVPVAEGFEVAHINIPICYGSVDQCVHRLTGAFGMTLRGMNVGCSYSTTFPAWPCHIEGCVL